MDFNHFLELCDPLSQAVSDDNSELIKKISRHRSKQNIDPNNPARRAAVLCLLYPGKNNEAYFILTRREEYPGVHSAQVSFPGGKTEKIDSTLYETATRETNEEIGVPVESINFVRTLNDLYIPPSNFLVSPFVGLTKSKPVFKTNREVAALLEVNLKDLLNDKNLKDTVMNFEDGRNVETQYFDLNNHKVWGATAIILYEFRTLIKGLL
jgi:8-oxo-dGTP pyrophosphatase MutT (NUDIX family)